MSDTGLLKIRQGKLLLRNGKLAKTCLIKRTSNACPLCGDAGTGFWRDITIAGIETAFEACIAIGATQSINVTVPPTVLPNAVRRVPFYGFVKNEFYEGDGLTELVDRHMTQEELFQGGDYVFEDEHCLWRWSQACTGEWVYYFASATCGGAPRTHEIIAITIELKLFADQWRLEGYYTGTWGGVAYRLYFAYGVAPRAGDTANITFSDIYLVRSGPFSNGNASVVSLGDPLAQDGLGQHSPHAVLFQGDFF